MAQQASRQDRLSLILEEVRAEEWMLVRLRGQLYGGSWGEMRTDLECRRRGQPYIFKLVHRIEEDLQRIDRLERIEAEWGIDLGAHLPNVEN